MAHKPPKTPKTPTPTPTPTPAKKRARRQVRRINGVLQVVFVDVVSGEIVPYDKLSEYEITTADLPNPPTPTPNTGGGNNDDDDDDRRGGGGGGRESSVGDPFNPHWNPNAPPPGGSRGTGDILGDFKKAGQRLKDAGTNIRINTQDALKTLIGGIDTRDDVGFMPTWQELDKFRQTGQQPNHRLPPSGGGPAPGETIHVPRNPATIHEPLPAPAPLDLMGGSGSVQKVATLDDYLARIRSVESGGNDSAKNPKSSATGRYQFIDSTWTDLVARYPNSGLTRNGRLDPEQQEIAIRPFTAENQQALMKAGLPSTYANLYAAHFLGSDGAIKVLSAPANTPISQLVSSGVMKANPHLNGMTVANFQNWTTRKVGQGEVEPLEIDPATGRVFSTIARDVPLPMARPNPTIAQQLGGKPPAGLMQLQAPAGTSFMDQALAASGLIPEVPPLPMRPDAVTNDPMSLQPVGLPEGRHFTDYLHKDGSTTRMPLAGSNEQPIPHDWHPSKFIRDFREATAGTPMPPTPGFVDPSASFAGTSLPGSTMPGMTKFDQFGNVQSGGGGFNDNPALQAIKEAYLGVINKAEGSPDEHTLFGYRTIDDLSWHPNIKVPYNDGKDFSTAAGYGQFNYATWQEWAAKAGVKDFSRESQIKTMWTLAEANYKDRTGRALLPDLMSGNPDAIASAFVNNANRWASLPGGKQPRVSVNDVVNDFLSVTKDARTNLAASGAVGMVPGLGTSKQAAMNGAAANLTGMVPGLGDMQSAKSTASSPTSSKSSSISHEKSTYVNQPTTPSTGTGSGTSPTKTTSPKSSTPEKSTYVNQPSPSPSSPGSISPSPKPSSSSSSSSPSPSKTSSSTPKSTTSAPKNTTTNSWTNLPW
jgi:muramidase (phage lysozyme)